MNKTNKNIRKKPAGWIMALLLVLFSVSGALAQSSNEAQTTLLVAVIVVGIVAVIVLLVSVYTLQVLNVILRTEEERKAKEAGIEPKPAKSLWQRFLKVVVYMILYHVTGTLPLPEEEYQIEMAEAQAMAEARQAASPEEEFNEADLKQAYITPSNMVYRIKE